MQQPSLAPPTPYNPSIVSDVGLCYTSNLLFAPRSDVGCVKAEKGGGMKQGSLTQTVDVFETPKKHSVISHLHPHHVLISESSFRSLQTLTQSTQSTKCTINIYCSQWLRKFVWLWWYNCSSTPLKQVDVWLPFISTFVTSTPSGSVLGAIVCMQCLCGYKSLEAIDCYGRQPPLVTHISFSLLPICVQHYQGIIAHLPNALNAPLSAPRQVAQQHCLLTRC
jgi:hypothetical protein